MSISLSRLRRFAVHGVFWRNSLDWAVLNFPPFFYPFMLWFWTFVFFFFAAPARRAVVSNLSQIFPGSSRLRNHLRAFRTFYNFACTITDAATFKLDRPEFRIEVTGAEFLAQLAQGQGAIVLTAHMGNYDLGAALFAREFQREIRMVRAPEPDRESAQHLTASLEKAGAGAVKIAYNTGGAMLSFDLLNALRRGEIISIQGDRASENIASAPAKLFGREILLPNGPFTLSLVAGAPIFPLFIARRGHRRYEIIARDPITIERSGRDREVDLAPAQEKWCTVLEEVVTKHWDQWFSLVPIWK